MTQDSPIRKLSFTLIQKVTNLSYKFIGENCNWVRPQPFFV